MSAPPGGEFVAVVPVAHVLACDGVADEFEGVGHFHFWEPCPAEGVEHQVFEVFADGFEVLLGPAGGAEVNLSVCWGFDEYPAGGAFAVGSDLGGEVYEPGCGVHGLSEFADEFGGGVVLLSPGELVDLFPYRVGVGGAYAYPCAEVADSAGEPVTDGECSEVDTEGLAGAGGGVPALGFGGGFSGFGAQLDDEGYGLGELGFHEAHAVGAGGGVGGVGADLAGVGQGEAPYMWGWVWLVNVFPGVVVGVVLGLVGSEGATDVAGDFDVDGVAGGAGYLGVRDAVLSH